MRKTVKRVLSMMLAVAMCMGLAVNVMAADKSLVQASTNEQYEAELNAFDELYYVLKQRKKAIEAEGGNFNEGLTDYNKIIAAQSSYREYFVNHGTVMSDAELFALLKDAQYVPKSEDEYELKQSIKWNARGGFVSVCSGNDYTVKENWPKELQKYRPMGEIEAVSNTDNSDWEAEAQAAAELLYQYGLFEGDENDDGTIDFHLNEIPDRVDAYIMWVDFWDKGEGLKYHDENNWMTAVKRQWETNDYYDVSDAEYMNYIYFAYHCRGLNSALDMKRYAGANNRDFESYLYRMLTGDGGAITTVQSNILITFANDYGLVEWLSDVEYLRYGDMALYALHSLTLKRADGELLVQNLVEHGQLTQAQANALISNVYLENPTVTATVSDFAEATPDEAADFLNELGLFGGVGTNEDGTINYDLNRTPNRAEAITMLVRLLGKETEAKAGTWDIPFTDVPEWAVPYVGYAYVNGLTGGISATEFGSINTATQAQYLTFILRAMGYKDGEDFVWDRAWELSDKLGLTDSTNQNGDFLRGDVAVISLKALVATPKSGETLGTTLLRAEVFTKEDAIAIGMMNDKATTIPDGETVTNNPNNKISDTTPTESDISTKVEYKDFTVTAYNRGAIGWTVTTTNLVIPETFVGNGKYGTTKGMHYKVTAIGDRAFEDCEKLISFTLPDSITDIGERAFAGCTSLASINLPNLLTTIKATTFGSCHSLMAIDIPDNVTSIENGVFFNCISLTSVKFPNGVKSIGRCFYGCTSLTTVVIPDTVETIAKDMITGNGINGNNNPTNIYYLGTELEWKAKGLSFGAGNRLLVFHFEDEDEGYEEFVVKSSNRAAIGWTETTTNLVIPETFVGDGQNGTVAGQKYKVTQIYYRAFAGCTSLVSVTLPNSIEGIDREAFLDCTSLEKVYMPRYLNAVNSYIFKGCTSLKTLYLSKYVEYVSITDTQVADIYYEGSEDDTFKVTGGTGSVTVHYNSTLPN